MVVVSSVPFPPEYALLDAFTEGVVLLDSDWRIRFVNRAAELLLAVPRSELEDKILGRDLLLRQEEHADVLMSVMREREHRSLGAFWAGAEPRVVLADAYPVRAGRMNDGIAIVYRDIRGQIASAVEAHAEMPEAVREFLTAMAHEIRTPVHAMLGYAELLRVGIDSAAEPVSTHLSRLEASSRHLLQLVENLLDLGRLVTGRLSVESTVARASTVAAAAVDVVSIEADARAVTLERECRESEPVYYVGDEDRVRQILLNLLMNAVKFTEHGGRVVIDCGSADSAAVPAGLPPADRWTYFSVRDTGIGIAAEELASIFEPYWQLSGGRRFRQGGVGLGLALSRDLARLMGGDLTAESEPGAGSTFTLWLPAGAPFAER